MQHRSGMCTARVLNHRRQILIDIHRLFNGSVFGTSKAVGPMMEIFLILFEARPIFLMTSHRKAIVVAQKLLLLELEWLERVAFHFAGKPIEIFLLSLKRSARRAWNLL